MATQFDTDNTLLKKILAALIAAGSGISAAVAAALALKEDKANKATSTSLGTSNVLYPSQGAAKAYADGILTNAQGYTDELTINAGTLTYNASTVIDLTSTNVILTETCTGDIAFTTTNRSAGRSITVRILPNGSTRALSFAAWTFIGAAAPTSIASGKVGVLTILCFGANETDIVAAYSVSP